MEKVAFNRDTFAAAFTASLDMLRDSEQITKRELLTLSRTVLEATHETGDIGYVNRLIGVLTPINRKVACLFFKTFTGFAYDDVSLLFTKKSQKRYPDAFAAYVAFMEDPNNNIWSWAAIHVEVEQKPFAVSKVGDLVKTALKKNISQADILREVFKAGVTVEALIDIMTEIVPAADTDKTMGKIAESLGFAADF